MFRNSYAFLLGPEVSPEMAEKVKKFGEQQAKFVDEMRAAENKLRDEQYNLYKQARDIAAIESEASYKYYMSNVLQNMVNTYVENSLPLATRSILKLYMADCPHCIDFVVPLKSIASNFLPGSLLTLEINTAMQDAYLRRVVDELSAAGWGGSVPAWFAVDPIASGGVRFTPIRIPSWASLVRENGDKDRARVQLATLLKEQLVASQMAKTVSEIKAEEYIGRAKSALSDAASYGKSMKREREAISRVLEADDDVDDITAKMRKLLSSVKDEDGNKYDLLGLNDESLRILMMDPSMSYPMWGSKLTRGTLVDYVSLLQDKSKNASASSSSSSSAPATSAPAAAAASAAPTAAPPSGASQSQGRFAQTAGVVGF